MRALKTRVGEILTLILFFSSEPSVSRKDSCPSVPSTRRKQLVVWPIPEGSTLSHSMALITELFPLLVLESKNRSYSQFLNNPVEQLFFERTQRNE